MSEKLRVGVVGVGGISGAHIPAWLEMEDVELAAICDIRSEQMEQYPDIKHYTDFDEMLSKESFDIIDICLPTFLHVDYAIKAMEKGINVLTEKPISLHDEAAVRAYAAAEKYGVRFMVAQCLRFWPSYVEVKKYFDTKQYGRLLSASMWRLGHAPQWSWDNWMLDEKRSGFIPYDLHIHDLDFIVHAFGAPNDYSVNRAKEKDQDYLSAVYQFEDFFITCESAWYKVDYPFQSGFRFQFEDALVVSEHGDFQVYTKDGEVLEPLSDNKGKGIAKSGIISSNAYANEIRYFADCVKNNTVPDMVKEEELRTVIRILNSFPGAEVE